MQADQAIVLVLCHMQDISGTLPEAPGALNAYGCRPLGLQGLFVPYLPSLHAATSQGIHGECIILLNIFLS